MKKLLAEFNGSDHTARILAAKKKKINIFNDLLVDNELHFQCHVVKSCALNLAFAELTRV